MSNRCFPFSQRVGRTGHRLEVKQLPSQRFVSAPSAAQALRCTWLEKNKVCRSRRQELLPPWNCRLREYHDRSRSSGREAGAKPAGLRDAVSPSRRRVSGLCSALSPEGSALARQPHGFAPSYPAKRPAAPGRSPSHGSCTNPSSPARGQTSSLCVPAPAVGSWLPHWSLSRSSWESFLCPSPTSSHQRSVVPAHPLQQSRGPQATRRRTETGS